MSGLRDSDAVAEALREQPPRLDDVAKARMERRLLEALSAPRAVAAPAPRRGAVLGIAAGGLAAAAAIGLGFFLIPDDVDDRVARMELHSVGATQQSGTIDEGSSLRTGPDEVARIEIEDSVVHLQPSTELRIEALTSERMAFALERGEVRVEFHPRRRGREGMSVRAPHATVEVVGTVFTVRAADTATEVSVTEGRVRVVPDAGAPRFVSAGESVRVGDERRAEARSEDRVEPAPTEAVDVADDAVALEPQTPPTERERHAQSPAQRLARARRLIAAGQNDEAAGLLRGVAGAADATPALRAQASLLLGDLLQRQGALAAAAEAYEAAARQGAGHLSHLAIYDLARMQERRMRDPSAARVTYRRYLDESENGPLVGQSRQALCRLGDEAMCATGEAEPTP